MRLRGGLLVLAIAAALFGAPPSAAAAGNTLTPLAASPTSGSAATPFTLRVAYDGRFAALAVTADVAGRTLPMALASGTPTSGTWSVTTLLPPGSWTVTYRATAEQGSSPVATGSSISVAGVVTTSPSAPPPGGGPPVDEEGTGVDPIASPGSPAPAAPASQAPSTAGMTPEPAAASPLVSPGGSSPGDGVHGTPAGGPASGGPEGSVASPGADPSDAGTGTPTEGGNQDGPVEGRAVPSGSTPSAGATPSATDPSRLVTDVLGAGLFAVAGIAALGTALLILTRRRTPPRLVVELPVAATATPHSEPDATSDLLDRRALRRARIVLDEDPIVASLVGDVERTAPQAAIRTGSERPRSARRAPRPPRPSR